MAAITPMTIPAIAPPLRPLLVVVDVIPAALAAVDAAVADMKPTVVVIDPVDVVVVMTLLVGRMKAVAVFVDVVDVTTLKRELLLSPLPTLAPHWPATTQYCPTAQHMVPQAPSPIDVSQEIAVVAATAATAVVVSASKKELYVEVYVARSVETYVVV